MRQAVERVGLTDLPAPLAPKPEHMQLKLDDFDLSRSFYGEWREHGQMIGNVIIHANGTGFCRARCAENSILAKLNWFLLKPAPHGDSKVRFVQKLRFTAHGRLSE